MGGKAVKTRLYVEEVLTGGLSLGLGHDQAHYLRSVLRLAAAAELAVFNAGDGEWLARIEGLGKGWCSIRLLEQLRLPVAEPDLWLIFAPIKRARIDFLAEKATELGCSLLQPVMTRRTDVSRVNEARLAANAREAAEQCERLSVPEVRATVSFAKLLQGWPRERRLLYCAEAGAARPLAEVLLEARGAASPGARPLYDQAWAVLIGPEGGFEQSELDGLEKLPFAVPVGLGPRVLRADTAALAALACCQAILGDAEDRPLGRN